jgi:TatD DNase family protein
MYNTFKKSLNCRQNLLGKIFRGEKTVEEKILVDTHCHLTMMGLVDNVVEEAAMTGVKKIISVSTTAKDSVETVEIARSASGVWATVGIHPCDVTPDWEVDFERIKSLVEKKKENKIIGIGETGLDFYHQPFDKELQIKLFRAHIELAIENKLPVVVHIRESEEDVLNILEQYKGKLSGVSHCFFLDEHGAKRLIDLGFYIGIGGPITYPKNNWLREVIKNVPLDSLVLETDAPFLPPQEFRGKKNHPKYLPLIAQKIAEIKNIEKAAIAQATTANVFRLFGI